MLNIYLELKKRNFSIKVKHPKLNKPLRDAVTAGIECMVGSAIYLKSTGIFLRKENPYF